MEFNYSYPSPTTVQAVTFPGYPFTQLPKAPQQVMEGKVIKGTTTGSTQGVRGSVGNNPR